MLNLPELKAVHVLIPGLLLPQAEHESGYLTQFEYSVHLHQVRQSGFVSAFAVSVTISSVIFCPSFNCST